MVTTVKSQGDFSTKLINGLLGIKPLAEFAKTQARKMIIKRANSIGVAWEDNVKSLQNHSWEKEINEVTNPHIQYPPYYLTSFHAYENGNLNWDAAWELESAAYSVHSTVYSTTPQKEGDRTLRSNYHQILKEELTEIPNKILDMGCGVGLSTFAIQEIYSEGDIDGLDLSPHFLAVAKYQGERKGKKINWIHAAAESSDLPSESYDLVSAFLMFHELPQEASHKIIKEAYRLTKKGGYFAIMDMNPQSEVYKKMPRHILTLLKSTEPYLDQYFSLDIESAFMKAGFETPKIIPLSKRHRGVIARK